MASIPVLGLLNGKEGESVEPALLSGYCSFFSAGGQQTTLITRCLPSTLMSPTSVPQHASQPSTRTVTRHSPAFFSSFFSSGMFCLRFELTTFEPASPQPANARPRLG